MARGVHTSLIYTVSAMNIDHLHRMPELVHELGWSVFYSGDRPCAETGLLAGPKPGHGLAGGSPTLAGRWSPEVGLARAADLGALMSTWPKGLALIRERRNFQLRGPKLAEEFLNLSPIGRGVYQVPRFWEG